MTASKTWIRNLKKKKKENKSLNHKQYVVHFANNSLTLQYINDKNKPPPFPSQQQKKKD